jgi:hypothetical protein
MTAEITAPASTDPAAELLTAVREHAKTHYAEGWDFIVEATSDTELAEIIGNSRSPKTAIAKAAKVVKLRAEQQAAIDAQASGKPEAPEQPKPLNTNERKRVVAAKLIAAAAELADTWAHDDVTRDEARALLSAWCNYIPGGVWDERLGERSGAGKRPVQK